MSKRNDVGTIARVAGNILSGESLSSVFDQPERYVHHAVKVARMIVAEVASTEPAEVEPVPQGPQS